MLLITTFSCIFPIKITVAEPPYTPSTPYPSNNSRDVSIQADLNWTGGDPDNGDKVTYDVYFGISKPLEHMINTTALSYDPGTLNFSTIYYWMIIAWDNHGESTEGPLWSFTTQPASGYTLTLTTDGTGSGTVEASPDGPYSYGVEVMIWANASVGSMFTGFSGDLSGMASPQSLEITDNMSVNAQFTLQSGFVLTLTKNGTGSGTVEASPDGPYSYGEEVTIWANASNGSIFAGFFGNLTGSTSPQNLNIDGDEAVVAEFTLNVPYTLSLTTSGTGSGTIQANASGPFYYGDVVRIWANASTGSIFTGFSGGLSGMSSPQDLIINGNTTVNAEFTFNGPYTLTLITRGTGSGTIEANNTSGPFYFGDVVRIWANASSGSTFSGFTGALTGKTSPQSLVMNGNKSVTATFTKSGGEPPEETPNIPPIADASAGEPYQGFINLKITFNGSKSSDTDGSITTWSWVFGDNSNGNGKTIEHTYVEPGTYTVILTVTDNQGATDTDTTTCMILTTSNESNRPPFQPSIKGPTSGTRSIPYIYTASSIDPDNDSIQYTFHWGDSSTPYMSVFLPNGSNFTQNHSWATAGRYNVTVTVTDNQLVSSYTIFVYIDALQTRGAGYLYDIDGDGVYDAFYSDETHKTVLVPTNGESYFIDKDGDGQWEYVYNATYGLTSYQEPRKTPGLELTLVLGAITMALILWRKKRFL